MSQSPWLAAHIFYADEPERLLTQAVKPLVEEIMAAGLAERYFFIRYFERGRHVRLRFQAPAQVLETQIKPKILAQINSWLEQNPSERDFERDDFLPNNTVHFIEYEPEIVRYGGPHAIDVAERLFQLSSDAALALVAESDEWSYERALGAALQKHLGFMYGLGWDLKQAQGFCRQVKQGWLAMVWYTGEKMDKDEFEKNKAETLEAFEKAFGEQKDGLLEFMSMMGQGLQQGADFEGPWLDEWIAGVREIGKSLDQFHERGELIYPSRYEPVGEAPKHWEVLESYVHMTNNRLGILNRDEAYLGYLINETFALFPETPQD